MLFIEEYDFDVLFSEVVSLLVHVCRFVEKNVLSFAVVRRNCAHHAHGISPGAVTSPSFTCNFVEEFCFLKNLTRHEICWMMMI